MGTYIYESASGQDPIYRLGMLFFFETKNIKHKPARAQLFHAYGDSVSEHDMDFDWADETMHAGYGKHWLKELLAVRGEDPAAYDQVRERCEKLVRDYVATRHRRGSRRHQEGSGRATGKSETKYPRTQLKLGGLLLMRLATMIVTWKQ